jgi:hypothetical protein
MKSKPDMDRIARGLGAVRRGKVRARGGAFGASGLLAEVQARFRNPVGGGRATDPEWTERRLIALSPETLARLEALAASLRGRSGTRVDPMQVAALLLARATRAADGAATSGFPGS